MVKKNYQVKISDPKKKAYVMAKNQPVSLKYSVELNREIKGKRIDKAETFLKNILEKKDFLPLRKYVHNIAHRKGKAKSFTKTGKYPKRLAKNYLKILENLKANADYKGLDSENLLIVHAFSSQGFRRASNQKQGRIGGKRHQSKSTHIEIVAVEAS
ncbi:MAG: 50S ribosomal protein L22 [Candidatus Diapherotrites archaeon]|nr:50S ribosomal protein L22 [Candidatus Diapherotrites archaeon]